MKVVWEPNTFGKAVLYTRPSDVLLSLQNPLGGFENCEFLPPWVNFSQFFLFNLIMTTRTLTGFPGLPRRFSGAFTTVPERVSRKRRLRFQVCLRPILRVACGTFLSNTRVRSLGKRLVLAEGSRISKGVSTEGLETAREEICGGRDR